MNVLRRSLLVCGVVCGVVIGGAEAADPVPSASPGRAAAAPAPAATPTSGRAAAAPAASGVTPTPARKPASGEGQGGPADEAVIRAATTPTPAETPTPTPTPCEGKFSCVPPEEPIEVAKGVWVRAGKKRSFSFDLIDSYGAGDVTIPVTMIRGERPGPTLLLTSTIHGDELNGLPVLLQLRERLDPKELTGLVIMLPVMNPHGFQRQTRYLPDRRDLNRYFPGNPRGSLANRIAHRIFETFVRPSDYLVDFHTASGSRSNTPHVRADPASEEARELAQSFGGIVVLHEAMPNTLRHAATSAGVPTTVFEGGENGRLDPQSIETGVRGVENVLAGLGMLVDSERTAAKPLWMTYSPWIRANTGGIVELAVGLGDLVQENQLLLTIRDTLQGRKTQVRAPTPGIVMAVARSPVAEPGYALLRLGVIERDEGPEPEPVEPEDAEEEVPE